MNPNDLPADVREILGLIADVFKRQKAETGHYHPFFIPAKAEK